MSSPVDSNALGQDLGNRHSLSTYRGGFISCFCRERGIWKPVCLSPCRDKS